MDAAEDQDMIEGLGIATNTLPDLPKDRLIHNIIWMSTTITLMKYARADAETEIVRYQKALENLVLKENIDSDVIRRALNDEYPPTMDDAALLETICANALKGTPAEPPPPKAALADPPP